MGNEVSCCANREKPAEFKAVEGEGEEPIAPSFEDEPEPGPPTQEAECLVSCKNEVGGSAVWCPRRQRLCWLDLSKQELWSFEPKEGAAVHQSVDLGWQGGCLALRKENGFVVCSALGIGLLDDSVVQHEGPRLNPRIVCHPVESEGLDSDVVRLHSGRVDPDGRLVIGTYHTKYELFTDELGSLVNDNLPDGKDPRGGVYRVSVTSSYIWGPQGQLEALSGLGKVCLANGMAFAEGKDGSHVMYFVDTPTRQVRSFKYGDVLSGETTVTEPMLHKGGPNGACSDSEGGYWIAEQGAGRVVRVKDGQISMIVTVASSMVTSCTFGGPGLGVLYITTARLKDQDLSDNSGGLFACSSTGYTGIPENYFDG